jgi:hypothetical protein
MTFSLDTPYMQSVASSRAWREGLHTAHAQAHKARYQYYLQWPCCNITYRGENPVQHRLVRIFCWLGLLCGTLLVALYVLAVPTAADSAPNTLLAAFDEVLQRVVSLRQLQPKGAIKRAVRNRQQIRTAVLALAQDALSPAEWEAERKAMVQWGLLAPDFRLKEFVLDLLTEQAAGYYDPKQQTFFIADWLPHFVQKPVMAHELVHALQDQYYNLQKNFDLVKDQADLSLARKALIEGDAMAVMLVYLLEPLGLTMEDLPDMGTLLQGSASLLRDQFQVYTRAPLILRQQLLFPYVHGLAFVKAALAHGGWPGLQRVYQHPPVSTQQIMHPEKYLAEPPVLPSEVPLHIPEEALRTPWKKLKRDVLGEFFLSVILQQFLPEEEARQSAAGWRGDRYELFEQQDSGRLLLVCVTTWDTPASAMAFFQSYHKLLALKYPSWTIQALEDQSGHLWQQDQTHVMLRRQEHFVHIVEGALAEDLPRLQALLERIMAVPAQLR